MTDKPFIMRLCGHDVPVNFTDPGNWQDQGMGRSNSLRGEIELSTKLTDVIHLMLDFHGFHQESQNEKLVNAMACGLLAWMKDNPKLVAVIAGQADSDE